MNWFESSWIEFVVAIAISECCICSEYGANIKLPPSESRLDRLLFAEGGARVLISCSNSQSLELKKYYKNYLLNESNLFSISHLGYVNDQRKLSVYQSNNLIIDIDLNNLIKSYKDSIYKKINK